MIKTLALLALTLPLLAQEGFDFKTLDKLGVNSINKTDITLNKDMLKLASGFLGSGTEADSLKPLVQSLSGVYVRTFEFDKEGLYNEADLEPLRTYLRQGQWNRIVESREGKDLSEVYLQPLANNRLGGVAIIAAEAKEVTVVFISGNIKQEDVQKLSGTMGIPDIRKQLDRKKGADKSEKKEDE